MDKIVVKWFDGEPKEQYFDDIELATIKYKELSFDLTIKACELFVVTKTVLKAFNR